ncbi:MAG: hypothetical protein IJT97_10375 [Bacteroidaceae bacterium]|nr:hypothetical protein [Bacteroidaceae bacterium]
MKKPFILLILSFLSLTPTWGAATGDVYPRVPADGAVNVAINAQIVLKGDVDIKQGPDSVFLNGEYMPVSSFAGGYAFIKPGQLQYATLYTLVVRDGAFLSKADDTPLTGGTYTFTTVGPSMKVFDAIVAKDGSGDYTSIRAAIKAAPQNRTTPWLIFVKNGVYEELVRVASNQSYISLVGEDRDNTVLKFAITSNGEHELNYSNFNDAEGQGPVLVTNAANFYLYNMTVINSWGYEKQAGPQALALGSYADRFTMYKTALKSYQDTWQTGKDDHRHFTRHCYIEGAVDFIYNSGNCVFDSCTIALCRNGSVIVAPSHGSGVKYGYVFRDCNIISSKPGTARTNNYFGRPWHNSPRASFINSTLSKDITFNTLGWIDHMGGLPEVFADYNTIDANGKPLDTSKRQDTYWNEQNGKRVEKKAKNSLTKEEADALTVQTVLSGQDGWKPEEIIKELAAPVVMIENGKLTWTPNIQAICYEVLYDGQFKAFTTETSYDLEGEASKYRVRAVNMHGTFGNTSDAPILNGIENESASELKMFYNGKNLVASGFSGKAQVTLFNMYGTEISRFEIEENNPMDTHTQFFLAKVVANTGTFVLKAVY